MVDFWSPRFGWLILAVAVCGAMGCRPDPGVQAPTGQPELSLWVYWHAVVLPGTDGERLMRYTIKPFVMNSGTASAVVPTACDRWPDSPQTEGVLWFITDVERLPGGTGIRESPSKFGLVHLGAGEITKLPTIYATSREELDPSTWSYKYEVTANAARMLDSWQGVLKGAQVFRE